MTLDFAAARLHAMDKRPYLAVPLASLVPVQRPGLGTFAVDRRGRVYWDPTLNWKTAEAAWAILHELQHWLRGHADRAKPFLQSGGCKSCTAKRINDCQDAEINDDLEAEGGRLPEHEIRIFPRTLNQPRNLLWEQYYAAMPHSDTHQHQDELCGSAAHGIPQDYEEPDDGAPGYGPVEVDLIRDQTARDILAYSRVHGTVGGRLLRWATERVRPPRVPWEREMAAQAQASCHLVAGAYDYSYIRPSRRGQFLGVIRPAMVRPIPSVAVVLDTSASMGSAVELPLALAEIPGIVRALGQRAVPVICCDTETAAAQRVTQVQHLQLQGGGGTDMGSGIAEAAKLARVVIVLTDGWTPWPTTPPVGIEIIVGLVGSHAARPDSVPSYARAVIPIRDDLEP